jgi:hypothetical protein
MNVELKSPVKRQQNRGFTAKLLLAFAVGVAFAVALELLPGCASAEKSTEPGAAQTSDSEKASENAAGKTAGKTKEEIYFALVEKFSAGDREYNGFYNQFDFKATLHNTIVQEATLKRQADYYQWDAAKLESEMSKAAAEMNRETYVFCSFFTPDRRNDNLSDSKSIWRVFLDVGGKRYVGKVKKSRKLLAELQALYPQHTRWTTAYVFTFPAPVAAVDAQAATLTITGPLGGRAVTFAVGK